MKFVTTTRWAALLLLTTGLAGCITPEPKPPGHEGFLENSATVQQSKRTYRLGHNAPVGSSVTWLELATCLPASWKPHCAAGGTLSPGPIGQQMKCTVHGQLPPEDRGPIYK